MTQCPPFEELIALIDGELMTGRELAIRWHLDICSACTRFADGVVALKRAVGRAHDREIPSPALRRSVMAHAPKPKRGWKLRAGAFAAPLFMATGAILFCCGPLAAGTGADQVGLRCDRVQPIGIVACVRREELVPAPESF